MSLEVEIRNRQRRWTVDARRLRAAAVGAMTEEFGLAEAVLGIHLIGERTMASMNWAWLRHEGSTDILTFDHRSREDAPMYGELFVSVDDAVKQAAEFGARPDVELFRYVIHGILHLLGHRDDEASARRAMKTIENRIVRRWMNRAGVRGLVGSRAKRGGSRRGANAAVGGRRRP